MPTPLLPIPEIARLLAVRPATVRSWIARGVLSAIKLGRQYRVEEAAVDRLTRTGLPSVAPAPRTPARWTAPAPDGLGLGETPRARRRAARRAADGAPAAPVGRQAPGNSTNDSASYGLAVQVPAAQRASGGFTEDSTGINAAEPVLAEQAGG